mmetsp:Transcript_23521/g.48182  ORF Transcript_23521/g.48182 Transcript_23521/m.48182 type:complete len:146 (+) Transcript_23521:95-532(+)
MSIRRPSSRCANEAHAGSRESSNTEAGRTIAVHAKRARGWMDGRSDPIRTMATNSMSLNRISRPTHSSTFDLESKLHVPSVRTNGIDLQKRGGRDHFSISALASLQQQQREGNESLAKKQKTKKAKEQPLTVVFDRPGTWKRPNN